MIALSRGTGWRRQRPDHRDRLYSAPAPVLRQLPAVVDLRHSGFSMPVYDQLATSSCTGNGPGALVHFCLIKEGLATPQQVPSRLFAYYNGREITGDTTIDGGAEIRDVIKGLVTHGICFECGPDGAVRPEDWPFDPRAVLTKPPQACYDAALKDRALEYQAVPQVINQLRACLADGFPFTFGMNVFAEFDGQEVDQTGRLPMPGPNEASASGHCVDAWGFDDTNRCFLIRNSWGPLWSKSMKGFFLIPYEYVIDPNLSSDFWTIRTVGA